MGACTVSTVVPAASLANSKCIVSKRIFLNDRVARMALVRSLVELIGKIIHLELARLPAGTTVDTVHAPIDDFRF